MARKDLGLTKVEQLKGLKVANQTGSSVGNIFVDQIAPAAGLKKGDYQEVRMDVNNMVAAMAAKTVDAMVNVEPYNAIAEADGLATTIMDYWGVDKMPVFMAATPEFVAKSPDAIVAYLKAWLDVARDFKEQPEQGGRRHLCASTPRRATPCRRRRSARRWPPSTSTPASRPICKPYMQRQAEILLKEKKIAAIPDWSKALRPDFHGAGAEVNVGREGARPLASALGALLQQLREGSDPCPTHTCPARERYWPGTSHPSNVALREKKACREERERCDGEDRRGGLTAHAEAFGLCALPGPQLPHSMAGRPADLVRFRDGDADPRLVHAGRDRLGAAALAVRGPAVRRARWWRRCSAWSATGSATAICSAPCGPSTRCWPPTLMAIALAGALSPYAVFVIAGLMGLVRPSDLGVRGALVAHIVPAEQLMGAMGISRTTSDVARVMGALAGAGLFAKFGIGAAYVVVTAFMRWACCWCWRWAAPGADAFAGRGGRDASRPSHWSDLWRAWPACGRHRRCSPACGWRCWSTCRLFRSPALLPYVAREI